MKILVGNSTEAVIANFIRYILFRSKSYNIVSLDPLKNLSTDKNLCYKHRLNNFYIGDFSNMGFLEKVIGFENPDYIVYSCNENNISIDNIKHFDIPFLLITNNKKMEKAHSNVLLYPNIFGYRENEDGVVFSIMKNMIEGKKCISGNIPLPFVFAEDVASLIWYMIENKLNKIIKMPALGYYTIDNICEKVSLLCNMDYQSGPVFDGIVKYSGDKLKWIPDSKNIEESLKTTIEWYSKNNWIFKRRFN